MDPARPSTLKLRVASALVMAPVALAAVWFGWPWLPLLVAAAAVLMGWEWGRLCAAPDGSRAAFLMAVAPLLAVVPAALGASAGGLVVALLGGFVVFLAAHMARMAEPLWAAVGIVWIAVPCVAFVYIAAEPGVGRAAVLWLLGLVWATDIGAYAAGRRIGGPRLAPRLSPNKTWSGALGGLAAAGLTGFVATRLHGGSAVVVVLVSIGLSAVAQLGDLAESMAKRHFRVKDSSGLIPGHGGLLDRLDSVLTAGMVQALLTASVGASPLVWRS